MLRGRLLGVDTGLKRTGLAISEPAAQIVVPLAILETGRRALDAVAAEVVARAKAAGVEGIVIGLPLNLDGSEGEQARAARAFGRRICRLSDLPLEYWDERLSTHEAQVRLQDAEVTGGLRRRHRRLDDLAAVVLLQRYIEAARRSLAASVEGAQ